MSRHIAVLIQEAREYTEAYARKYNVTDEESLRAIFHSHLAHLVNSL